MNQDCGGGNGEDEANVRYIQEVELKRERLSHWIIDLGGGVSLTKSGAMLREYFHVLNLRGLRNMQIAVSC